MDQHVPDISVSHYTAYTQTKYTYSAGSNPDTGAHPHGNTRERAKSEPKMTIPPTGQAGCPPQGVRTLIPEAKNLWP